MEVAPKELPGPYEILELSDGESKTLTILKYQEGTITIHPRYLPAGTAKVVRALRVYVPRSEKPTGTDYWDITSQTLVYTLLPFLRSKIPRRIKITAHGYAPKKRYSLEVIE